MTSRAKLQEKTLDELRVIAASLSVPDHEQLQKSKLIAAILDSDDFEVSSEPAPVDLPGIEEVRRADAESPNGEAAADSGDGDAETEQEEDSSKDDSDDGGEESKPRD